MAKTYNTLTIEVKEDITDIITAKQDDTQSRYLDVYLQDDGQPINLTGQEVRIYGKKQDGKSFFNNGEITNATQGRCQFELTNQALAVAGKLQVEISIWQNNERILTTQTFLINVMPKIRNDDAIESSNEFGAVVILFQKLYDFWLDIEKLLGKTDDTGGSLTTGTVMAKLNQLLTDIAQQGGNIQYKISDTIQDTIKKSIQKDTKIPLPYYKIYQFHAKYDGCIAAYATVSDKTVDCSLYVLRSLHDYVNLSGSGTANRAVTPMVAPVIFTSELGTFPQYEISYYLFNSHGTYNDYEFTNLILGRNYSTFGTSANQYRGTILMDTTIPVKKGEEIVFMLYAYTYDNPVDVTLQIKYDEAKV